MTGLIPHSFIEQLLARVDIVEIIGGRIALRRAGANFLACCPFHQEKTPSFTISPVKQFYHCFGCGANGDAIRFLTEYDGLNFVEAVSDLAGRVGLVVPREADEKGTADYTGLYAILAEAAAFYQEQLRKHPLCESAHHYLKSRGLTGKIAKEFGLGFAPPGWDNLFRALGNTEVRIESLLNAGLLVSKEQNKYYDRFRERIMFPIQDRRGRVVGFGGRVFNQGEPKYLNSPETPVFNKGYELYGLYEARAGNRALKRLVVVEGYLDVVGLVQFGFKEVVATLGTALTTQHIEALFKQVQELTFCFDGDKAGRAAAQKSMRLLLPHMREGRRVRFVLLPEGEDPDSFVRKQGKAAFSERLERAISLTDFLFESTSAELDLNHVEGRAEWVAQTKPLIMQLPKGILQQMMFDRLAELSGVERTALSGKRPFQFKTRFGAQAVRTRTLPATPAIRAAALLLKNRCLLENIDEVTDWQTADIQGTILLCAMIDVFKIEPNISAREVAAKLPENCAEQFIISELDAVFSSVPAEGYKEEFLGALQRLKERAEEQRMEILLLQAKKGALSSEERVCLRNLLELKDKNRVD